MPINWDEIAEQAGQLTDIQFLSQISSLTSLNDHEIENLMNDTRIGKVDLTNVLKVIKDASKSNNDKAKAIINISKGVDVLVGLATKFI